MLFRNFLIVTLLLSAAAAFAQDNTPTPKEIPVGMEEMRLGSGATLIVPKGAKIREVGSQVIVEGTKEYMSRKFYELKETQAKTEKTQTGFQEKLDALNGLIKEMSDRIASDELSRKELQGQLDDLQTQVKELKDKMAKQDNADKKELPKAETKQK